MSRNEQARKKQERKQQEPEVFDRFDYGGISVKWMFHTGFSAAIVRDNDCLTVDNRPTIFCEVPFVFGTEKAEKEAIEKCVFIACSLNEFVSKNPGIF